MVTLVGVLFAPLPVQAKNMGLKRCSAYTEVDAGTTTQLSSKPSLVCSFGCLATANSGSAAVYDSPDGTVAHAQAKRVVEAGAASSGDYGSAMMPVPGAYTDFGLTVETGSCRAYITWDD